MTKPKLLEQLHLTKILENKESRPKTMGHNRSEDINSENSRETLRFPKKKIEKSRASLGKNIRNF